MPFLSFKLAQWTSLKDKDLAILVSLIKLRNVVCLRQHRG